ncbi:MAG: hypothetical protein RIF41_04965 [Polyangiaceae bacterium]
MYCFVKGEPEGQDAKRWLDHATTLATACAREIHGDDDRSWFHVVSAVRTAASALWHRSPGRPSWSQLDASTLSAFMERQELSHEMMESYAFDVYVFFTFMRRHGLVSGATACSVQEKLWPVVAPLYERAMAMELGDADSESAAAMLGATFASTQPVGLA